MPAFAFLVTALAIVAAALFVLAGAMLTWEVLARYFFTAPTVWAAEFSQLCLIWGTLIAMPWCLRERRHIRITAVTGMLPEGGRRIAETFAMAAVAVFSALVLWKGWAIFWDSFERGRGSSDSLMGTPAWVPEAAVPFGFALLLIQALIEATRAIRGDIQPEGAHGE
jgi:TRAP-type C4-dicarboxylate transport system permease small subunit